MSYSSIFTLDNGNVCLVQQRPCLYTEPIIISSGDAYIKLIVLDTNKDMHSDKIYPRVLKTHADMLSPVLSSWSNLTLLRGIVLSDWPTTILCPIIKNDDRDDASNYCPLNLESPFGKSRNVHLTIK